MITSKPGPDALDILLVEDNPGDAMLIRMQLEESGLGVNRLQGVERLEQAMRAQQDDPAELVLLDLNLPDSQGLETLYTFTDRFPRVAVIVLTGLKDGGLAVDAVRTGAQDYLEKDELSPTWLAKSIRYALERQRLAQIQREMALRDPLTGLYNRRGFDMLAEQQFRLAERKGSGLTIVFLDVDRLKYTNDTYGHAQGDQLLKDLARILQMTFRESDIIGRIGGDEFAVLALDTQEPDSEVLLRRFQEGLAAFRDGTGRLYPLEVSAGLAHAQGREEFDLEHLLEEADAAMYADKKHRAKRRDG